MITVRANEVRIPRRAREAVARGEEVVVMNRERPAFRLVHPEDHRSRAVHRRGRPLREALELVLSGPRADPGFAEDMEAVLRSVGAMPDDPWERS